MTEPNNIAGLDLLVGSMFTVRPGEDRDAFEQEKEWLSNIQDLLREYNIEVDLLSRPGVEIWEGEIEHFKDLYDLRLVAAYIEQGQDISAILNAADFDSEPDPLLESIWQETLPTRFPHLIKHQAENGYYLPVDFAEPLWIEFDEEEEEEEDLDDDDDFEGQNDNVVSFGSSVGLQREMVELEALLRQHSVSENHAVFRCLHVLRIAADQSVSSDLPIVVW